MLSSAEAISREWKERFINDDSLWIHDENPNRPHALLTNGGHSDGFFSAIETIRCAKCLTEACSDLSDLLPASRPEHVFGSALGAITIASELARLRGTNYGFTEEVIEKVEGKDVKTMQVKRFPVKEGDIVIVVEDVMTTGGTTERTIDAIRRKGGIVLPKIGVLFNRSGMTHLGEYEIVALVHHKLNNWKAEDCPLCKAGSQAVRPKANWDKLKGIYPKF